MQILYIHISEQDMWATWQQKNRQLVSVFQFVISDEFCQTLTVVVLKPSQCRIKCVSLWLIIQCVCVCSCVCTSEWNNNNYSVICGQNVCYYLLNFVWNVNHTFSIIIFHPTSIVSVILHLCILHSSVTFFYVSWCVTVIFDQQKLSPSLLHCACFVNCSYC